MRAIAGLYTHGCVVYGCSVLCKCDWIKDYATYATSVERPLHAPYVDTMSTVLKPLRRLEMSATAVSWSGGPFFGRLQGGRHEEMGA